MTVWGPEKLRNEALSIRNKMKNAEEETKHNSFLMALSN